MKLQRYFLVVIMLLAVATAGLMASGCARPEAAGPKPTIKFVDTGWQTLWINTAIAEFIIEQGYGYPVEVVTITTPVMQQSLPVGEVHVHMELWRTNVMDWYTTVTEEGTVSDLGDTFESSTQGWYVPRYVIEGDTERGIEPMAPDLESVFDLERYKDVFADPEEPSKGLLLNGIVGWNVTEINKVKLTAYGLADDYNTMDPGSSAALDAAIAGAFERGEPILFYYWEPTWLLGTYDAVKLAEPAYASDVTDKLQAVVDGKMDISEITEACAYEAIGIHKGVWAGLRDLAPDVVEMLEKMNVGTDPLQKTAAYMEADETDADEAALWFFANYEDRWRSWVTPEAAEKIEAALIEAGVELGG